MDLGKRALHIPTAKATGAHIHPPGRTIHHHANALHIGRPDPVTLAVGMADVVPVHRALLANLTKLTHGNPPPTGVLHIKPAYDITEENKNQAFLQKNICLKFSLNRRGKMW